MAAKFFTGLPLDGPDPECVYGHGAEALANAGAPSGAPRPGAGHSRLDRLGNPVNGPTPVRFRPTARP